MLSIKIILIAAIIFISGHTIAFEDPRSWVFPGGICILLIGLITHTYSRKPGQTPNKTTQIFIISGIAVSSYGKLIQ